MVKKDVNTWQLGQSGEAAQVITRILMDGEWHRYQELRQKAGMSSATLSKHLKELEKGIVEKEIRLESGEYPYPVVYRIKEKYQAPIKRLEESVGREIFTVIHFTKDGIKIDTVQKSLKTAANALGETVNEAYEIALNDNNWKAFQQTIGTALAYYNDALRAVIKKENT